MNYKSINYRVISKTSKFQKLSNETGRIDLPFSSSKYSKLVKEYNDITSKYSEEIINRLFILESKPGYYMWVESTDTELNNLSYNNPSNNEGFKNITNRLNQLAKTNSNLNYISKQFNLKEYYSPIEDFCKSELLEIIHPKDIDMYYDHVCKELSKTEFTPESHETKAIIKTYSAMLDMVNTNKSTNIDIKSDTLILEYTDFLDCYIWQINRKSYNRNPR